jgi:hypothetical protein
MPSHTADPHVRSMLSALELTMCRQCDDGVWAFLTAEY